MWPLWFAATCGTVIPQFDGRYEMYSEYMTEAFLVDGKVKGYKKGDAKPAVRTKRQYARIAKEGLDSIFRPDAKVAQPS